MERMSGKVAIVTGAARGIGLAAARLLVAEGAQVFLVDRDEAPLKQAAEALGNRMTVAWLAADVRNEDEVKAYVRACTEQFGGVDVLIDNAGIEGRMASLVDTTDEDFQRVLDVNVKGAWYGIKHAAPEIAKRGGGSIVITSSVAGLIGSAGLGPYVCSKHAVVGMMKVAAIELAPLGIRVNTVNPGPIETRMMRSIEKMASPEQPEAVKAGFNAMVPLKRYGNPEEVAALMLFLASDEASYCTGGTYTVDGGFVAQ
jgi:NAD(P)-dependent dehydrogenase (short-subunit alcohol dehydrogenase family)